MMELIKDKRKLILAVFVCLFAMSLVYRLTHIYKQPKATTLTYTKEKAVTGDKKAVQKDVTTSAQAPMIKLDMFLNPPAHSRDVKKNIFSGQAAPVEHEKVSLETVTETKPVGVSPAENAEDQIKDDLSAFRSFGYAERGGQKTLFIEKGKQIMLIRKGDRIEGKYIVKDITQNELTLLVIASNEIVHIDLSQL
jgi:hypothetical protein